MVLKINLSSIFNSKSFQKNQTSTTYDEFVGVDVKCKDVVLGKITKIEDGIAFIECTGPCVFNIIPDNFESIEFIFDDCGQWMEWPRKINSPNFKKNGYLILYSDGIEYKIGVGTLDKSGMYFKDFLKKKRDGNVDHYVEYVLDLGTILKLTCWNSMEVSPTDNELKLVKIKSRNKIFTYPARVYTGDEHWCWVLDGKIPFDDDDWDILEWIDLPRLPEPYRSAILSDASLRKEK